MLGLDEIAWLNLEASVVQMFLKIFVFEWNVLMKYPEV